jgi:hypothetical protein
MEASETPWQRTLENEFHPWYAGANPPGDRPGDLLTKSYYIYNKN